MDHIPHEILEEILFLVPHDDAEEIYLEQRRHSDLKWPQTRLRRCLTRLQTVSKYWRHVLRDSGRLWVTFLKATRDEYPTLSAEERMNDIKTWISALAVSETRNSCLVVRLDYATPSMFPGIPNASRKARDTHELVCYLLSLQSHSQRIWSAYFKFPLVQPLIGIINDFGSFRRLEKLTIVEGHLPAWRIPPAVGPPDQLDLCRMRPSRLEIQGHYTLRKIIGSTPHPLVRDYLKEGYTSSTLQLVPPHTGLQFLRNEDIELEELRLPQFHYHLTGLEFTELKRLRRLHLTVPIVSYVWFVGDFGLSNLTHLDISILTSNHLPLARRHSKNLPELPNIVDLQFRVKTLWDEDIHRIFQSLTPPCLRILCLRITHPVNEISVGYAKELVSSLGHLIKRKPSEFNPSDSSSLTITLAVSTDDATSFTDLIWCFSPSSFSFITALSLVRHYFSPATESDSEDSPVPIHLRHLTTLYLTNFTEDLTRDLFVAIFICPALTSIHFLMEKDDHLPRVERDEISSIFHNSSPDPLLLPIFANLTTLTIPIPPLNETNKRARDSKAVLAHFPSVHDLRLQFVFTASEPVDLAPLSSVIPFSYSFGSKSKQAAPPITLPSLTRLEITLYSVHLRPSSVIAAATNKDLLKLGASRMKRGFPLTYCSLALEWPDFRSEKPCRVKIWDSTPSSHPGQISRMIVAQTVKMLARLNPLAGTKPTCI